MQYFIYLLKKGIKSVFVMTVLILVLWGLLYHLTDLDTVLKYFEIGVVVCAINTLIYNFQKHREPSLFYVKGLWIVMAGIVLVLYYAGFDSAAVFAAAVFFVSPFFGATILETIVGLSLLIVLACYLP